MRLCFVNSVSLLVNKYMKEIKQHTYQISPFKSIIITEDKMSLIVSNIKESTYWIYSTTINTFNYFYFRIIIVIMS